MDIPRAPCEHEAMSRRTASGFLATAALVLLTGCETMAEPARAGAAKTRIHYLEIVCRDVAAQCASLERVHGLSFGPPVADLGQARVATAPDGSTIGVRAPLAGHEQPIIRTYLEVADIARAAKEAEATGGVIAYPPTRQGDTGTWSIYSFGDVQFGLWQR
jgi:predicted enzyme related to lactoylglutathione lyase